MKFLKIVLFCTFISVLVLAGCISPKSTIQSITSTVTSAITPGLPTPTTLVFTQTIITTPTLHPTFTPYPTQSAIQLERTIKLLESDTCALPCHLGITPGETKLSDARKILFDLGAVFLGNYLENDLPSYGYVIKYWEKAEVDGLSPIWRMFFEYIYLVEGEGRVQRIVSSISADIVPFFEEHWSQYTLKEILIQLGEPDQVYFAISRSSIVYGITIVYENQGIVAETDGYKDGNSLCTNEGFPERILFRLHLTLTNLSSGLSLYDPNRVPPTALEVWHPIEDVLGINKKEFYDQIIADPEVCFEVKTFAP